ncbi:hypothetical protein D9M72_441860 [compost metagenome]
MYLTKLSVKLTFSQPALFTSQIASAIITTYTAGPAQSMNLRMVSMPVQNTSACNTQSTMNAAQPSVESPAKPCSFTSAYGASAGKKCSASTRKALEAR